MDMALALIPIAGILGGTTMVIGVVWLIASTRLKSAQVHADTVGKVVDKIVSSQEAMAYLESESGRKLLDSLGSRPSNPHSRILTAATIGIVLFAFGVGLTVLGNTAIGDGEAIGFGIVMISLGAGFLIAAAVSYKLSKSWGLMNGHDGSSGSEPPFPVAQ